jgi:nicotinamide riboside kinase
MKTYVVNLLGGSGLGKSTIAAAVFAELKMRKQHCELVREYVKELAWAGKVVGPFGQSIIYGRQLERESDLYNKVDIVVTDSPLILCPVYQHHYSGHDTVKHAIFKDLETARSQGVNHVNFLLDRQKEFDQRGRYEDESTAKLIDQKVKAFLVYHGISFISVNVPDAERVKYIADKIMSLMSEESNDRKNL